ncbi:cystathionine beta-synthase [Kitasatospora sp. NBC_01539]|uniref:cystathionine beta-synthase n=1 Tax=Kitasatospora sp. NBC_01539 TaxID=2903577 RepID=UPI0038601836
MQFADSILEAIGDTPLVRLRNVVDTQALVLAKVEYVNPGGSVKDRIGLAMLDAAEKSGAIRPGGTIVEPTSGNTGIGLAMAAQQRGYQCVFVVPDKVNEDKQAVLRAYGARVVVCPTAVPPDHPESYYSVSDRLAREIPGAWKPDQYANPANPQAHFDSTGPEIWRQTGGRITHFVAGVGTGGTITGTGRFLKEASGGAVRVIGADPVGSVYSGGDGRPYLVEGVGEDIWPGNFDPSVCDDVLAVSDHEAFATTRALARTEGLLVGGSSGLAVAAAARAARSLGPDDVMVVLLPDGGRGYLSRIFNDSWMDAHGFGVETPAGDFCVQDILQAKRDALPLLVFARPHQTVGDSIAQMRRHGISQLPVLLDRHPANIAEVVGSVTELDLFDGLSSGRISSGDPVRAHMSGPMPFVGAAEPVATAIGALTRHPAVIVADEGRSSDILTRHDVLGFLTRNG